MVPISPKHIRAACAAVAVAFLMTHAALWAERHGHAGAAIQNASALRHQGMLVSRPALLALGILTLGLLATALIGTAMFKNWGRRLLALSVAANFAFGALQGVIVQGPLSVLTIGAFGAIHIWLVSVCFWAPISKKFSDPKSITAT